MPGVREPLVVSFFFHVLDGDQISGIPLTVQSSKDLGRLIITPGLDVDAALVAFGVDGHVDDAARRTTMKNLLLHLPHPGSLAVAAGRRPCEHGLSVKHVADFETAGRRHGRSSHVLVEATEGRSLPRR